MKTGRTWLVYTLIRLGIFAVALGVLLLTQMTPWIATLLAAVIALCASYIFLRRPREELAAGLYEARHGEGNPAKRAPGKAGSDEENEDAVVDTASAAETDERPAATRNIATDRPAVTNTVADRSAVTNTVADRPAVSSADDTPSR